MYKKIKTKLNHKPLFETDTSNELELQLQSHPEEFENYQKLSKVNTQNFEIDGLTKEQLIQEIDKENFYKGEQQKILALNNKCALLEEKCQILVQQYEHKLSDMQDGFNIKLLEKENEYQKLLQQKEQEWNKAMLKSREKYEARLGEVLKMVAENDQTWQDLNTKSTEVHESGEHRFDRARSTRELNSRLTKDYPKSVKNYREEYLDQISDLHQVKKDLLGENSLLKSKIHRLEEKVKTYKNDKYRQNYEEPEEIFSETLNCKSREIVKILVLVVKTFGFVVCSDTHL